MFRFTGILTVTFLATTLLVQAQSVNLGWEYHFNQTNELTNISFDQLEVGGSVLPTNQIIDVYWAILPNQQVACGASTPGFEALSPPYELAKPATPAEICLRVLYVSDGGSQIAYGQTKMMTLLTRLVDQTLVIEPQAGHTNYGYLKTPQVDLTTIACGTNQSDDLYASFGDDYRLSLPTTSHNKYYCLRAQAPSGQFVYQSYLVDLVAPAISISQSNRDVVASANDLSVRETSWRHSWPQPDDPGDCSLADFNQVGSSFRLIGNNDRQGWYVCFRVSDQAGNIGYGRHRILGLDFSPPMVTISQTPRQTIQAIDDDLSPSTWRYLALGPNQVCGPTIIPTASTYSESTEIPLLASAPSNIYCFWSQDDAGNIGFAQIAADRTPPSLQIIQNNTSLVASSLEQTDTISHLRLQAQTDCALANRNQVYERGGQLRLEESDNGTYVCFLASDRFGNLTYASHLITDVSVNRSVINAYQSGQTVKASSSDELVDWRYQVLPPGSNCDRVAVTDLSPTYRPGDDLSIGAQVGSVYCFRAQTPDGQPIFAGLAISPWAQSTTKLKIEQNGYRLLANNPDQLTEWVYVKLSNQVTCDQTTDFVLAKPYTPGSLVNISDQDVGSTYCFRALTQDGNFSFGWHQVLPVVTPESDNRFRNVIIVFTLTLSLIVILIGRLIAARRGKSPQIDLPTPYQADVAFKPRSADWSHQSRPTNVAPRPPAPEAPKPRQRPKVDL